MKTAMSRMRDIRPHPGPLPQERENRSQSRNISCDWIGRSAISDERTVRFPFPLPGGEGGRNY